jgi:Ca2+-binding EF-hand superfamily protein
MLQRVISALLIGCALITAQSVLQVARADPPSGDVIAQYDTDKDQTLSLDEVKAAASAHFDKLNKDGDSTLETNEVKGVLGPKAFAAADADHDGTISKSEYLALVEKLFKRADVNHDGTLNATELHSKAGRALKRLIN